MFRITGHKIYSKQEVLHKLQKYCAYQERSELQVAQKCKQYAMTESETIEIVESLKASNFLSNERFSQAFVDGKFKTKGWGKLKIQQGLKMAGISNQQIHESINHLDKESYNEKLENLAIKKWKLLKPTDVFEGKAKLTRYLAGKGYELDAILKVVEKLSL